MRCQSHRLWEYRATDAREHLVHLLHRIHSARQLQRSSPYHRKKRHASRSWEKSLISQTQRQDRVLERRIEPVCYEGLERLVWSRPRAVSVRILPAALEDAPLARSLAPRSVESYLDLSRFVASFRDGALHVASSRQTRFMYERLCDKVMCIIVQTWIYDINSDDIIGRW